jgi:large subunit ribosomal protein L25
MSKNTPTIEAVPRERTGSRYADRLRRSGRLPGIIYGHKTDPQAISVDTKQLLAMLHHGTHALEVAVTGNKAQTCLVKDLQFGHLGDNVIHVDFARVNLDEEVHCQVHLNFTGEPADMSKSDSILRYDLTELEVICKVRDIPEAIKVDLSSMESSFTVGELEMPANVRPAAPHETPVVSITFVREVEEETGEEAAVDATATEPEVITETKAAEDQEEKAEE